jgi:hypothetical protein
MFMSDYLLHIAAGIALMVIAIPYVMHIRHPEQKPVAAYFIFMTVFGLTAIVLFTIRL